MGEAARDGLTKSVRGSSSNCRTKPQSKGGLGVSVTPKLTRPATPCREELEKQRAKERYWKLHEQGKTEEARKDLGKSSFET